VCGAGLQLSQTAKNKLILIMKKLFTLFTALACTVSVGLAEQLVIKGSDTLGAKLVPQLAETFKSENPGTTFNIAAEGSSTCFSALIEKAANIGMSSRRAKATEVSSAAAKGLNLKAIIVAWDGIGIVVNANNPIKSLTKKQVEQIFTGDITDWGAIGGTPGKISIYTRNTSSGTYADFKELAMSKRDYAGSAQKMAGNEQIASEVGKNPSGIGYVGLAYLKTPGVKVIPVNGVAPTSTTIRSKEYPFSRPTFYYTNGEPSGAAKAFVDFTLSPKGQKIAEQVGFVSVK
jgi:phosphate transport system substrate-binding protein